MKIRTLLTVLSLATLATAAQAQWIAVQPGTVYGNAGETVTATYNLYGSSYYGAGTYTVATPCVAWLGAAPSAVSASVTDNSILVDYYPHYGYLIDNDDDVNITVTLTIPAGAVSGTSYSGTVYEPLVGTRAAYKNSVGNIVVTVN